LVSACGNDTLTQTIADVSNQEWKASDLKLYPNPAQDQIKVELPKSGKVEIALRDASGRRVRSWTLEVEAQVAQDLNLEGLSKGVYLIDVNQADLHYRERLLLK